MSAMNGVLSPPVNTGPTNASLSAKRKREDTTDNSQLNGNSNAESVISVGDVQQIIRDLVDVLKSQDPSSIMTRKLTTSSSNEHQTKRQKGANSTEQSTILDRASSNSYSTVEEILGDIDASVSDVLSETTSSNEAARTQYQSVSPEKNECLLKVAAFKKRAHDLVKKELTVRRETQHVNGASARANSSVPISADSVEKQMVLTLYGNAPQAKQLFSSLQLSKQTGNAEVLPFLSESGLPPGITTTQIMPIQTANKNEENSRAKTLGELFPTPATVRASEPPRPSKIGTTRETKVGWYQPAVADAPPRTASYFEQKITTGQWIDYRNASPAQSTKRKRDRAMSLGGSKAPQLDTDSGESEAAKLDALFRGAYSSFAPTKDNSAAIVPDGTVGKLWWQQTGEKSFARFVENATTKDEIATPEATEEGLVVVENELDLYREAVKWYETQTLDPELESAKEKSAEEKDVDEVLEGISELLETLNSYQRIRNMSLNLTSRAAGLLSASDTATVGTPAKPSDSEIATYEILKSHLTLMIASLPPFAVAKLKPDRLAELNISTKIPVELENYHGVMEEDEIASKPKGMLPVGGVSRNLQATSRASSTPSYNTGYASRTVAPNAQYYGSSQTPVRQNPVMQRPPATAPYQLQRPASGVAAYNRPQAAYNNTPAYAHQAARTVQQPSYNSATQYGASTSGSYATTPTQGYARPIGQSYQGAAQATGQGTQQNRYASQTNYNQTTTAQNGVLQRYGSGSVSNMNSVARQQSPAQTAWGTRQPDYDFTSRNNSYANGMPGYNSSTPNMMPNQRPYQQPVSTGTPTPSAMMNGSSASPQPQVAQQHAQPPQQRTTNYSTYLSNEQQHNILERQRATLAAQQQPPQQQARHDAAQTAGAIEPPSV
ncbi:hypothetical protein BJ878DRAFT_441579 [Calycina marina]|uniref:Uncharacterized protein n=1 Tax=Calycina marina TaxID=1763456 RepID=A0A9P7Z386_9HELO|nr:hypothetical protein BJ878DRAFT_441579 [Calycina marina]